MNSICKDIFRSIHEGKWLYIEYESKDSTRKKYWIAIHDINLEYKSLSVTGLHLGEFTTKDLTIYIEKIISSEIMDGTYYKTNIELTEDIEAFPQKYSSLFSNIANLKTLNYLSDCNKLSDLPKLNTQYELVNKLDSSKITKRTYKLDDDQFKHMVNSFKKRAESRKNKNNANILQIALNVLSIHTNKNNGLYVLAYREVRLDVEAKTLIAGNKIKICSEFCVDDTQEKRTKLSILNFLALLQKVWVEPKIILRHDSIFFKGEFAADEVNHGLEELSVPESPCSAFYVLNDAVHSLQNGIRVVTVKVVQDFSEMIFD